MLLPRKKNLLLGKCLSPNKNSRSENLVTHVDVPPKRRECAFLSYKPKINTSSSTVMNTGIPRIMQMLKNTVKKVKIQLLLVLHENTIANT